MWAPLLVAMVSAALLGDVASRDPTRGHHKQRYTQHKHNTISSPPDEQGAVSGPWANPKSFEKLEVLAPPSGTNNKASHPDTDRMFDLEGEEERDRGRDEGEDLETFAQEMMAKQAEDEESDEDAGKMGVAEAEEVEFRGDVRKALEGISANIISMQNTLLNLKMQNHLMAKQMKKIQNRCLNDHPARGHHKSYKVNSAPPIVSDSLTLEQPRCPADFQRSDVTGTCYRFATDRITWRMARERCRAAGADLVTIGSAREQRWLTDTARKSPDTRHCDFWTGATDQGSEKQWYWVSTGKILSYHNWNHNEPNNGRGDEHCMHMMWVFNWAWNDARCNYGNACYICEGEASVGSG